MRNVRGCGCGCAGCLLLPVRIILMLFRQSLVDLNPGWRMYIPALAARLSRIATGELKPLALLVLMGQLWADILVEHIPPDLQDVLPLGIARVLRLAYPDLQADQPNLWRVVLPPPAAEAIAALEAQMAAMPPDDNPVKASAQAGSESRRASSQPGESWWTRAKGAFQRKGRR